MKKYILLFVAFLAAATLCAENYITDVMVIGGSKSEVNALKASYAEQGWTLIDQDLNAGASGDYIYLLYKAASETTADASFITDFVISTVRDSIPDSLAYNGRNYCIVPCDGSNYFINGRGDLNSHCSGSAYIHLYYSKDYLASGQDYGTLKSITFDNTQEGAVAECGGTTGYDLNTGAGGRYIYMHLGKSQGWTVYNSVVENTCLISDLDAPKPIFKSITIPLTIGGRMVKEIKEINFLEFPNLETINFINGCVIEEMPSLAGCTKFTHVHVLSDTTFEMKESDALPRNMTKVPERAFAGTNLHILNFTDVTEFGTRLLEGCKNLDWIAIWRSDINVPDYTFSYIDGPCEIFTPHVSAIWLPPVYMYSPNVLIRIGTIWATGWCGGTSYESYNNLFWILSSDGQLRIQNYNVGWAGDPHPENNVITSIEWTKHSGYVPKVKSIFLDDVYTIPDQTFRDYSYTLKDVYMSSSVHYIGYAAFSHSSHVNLWFKGGQPEWDAVVKHDSWAWGANDFKVHWHCRVTYDANGHGTAPESQYIEWSNLNRASNPGAPTDADAGYNFTGWYTEPECVIQWNFDDVIPGDMTLYAGWETVYVTGDVDGSGEIDGNDLNMLINILLGKLAPTDDSVKGNPNVDGEGGIDGTDLNKLINIILGK